MKRTKKNVRASRPGSVSVVLGSGPTPSVHSTLQCLHRKQIAVGLLPLVPGEQGQPHLDAPTLPAN